MKKYNQIVNILKYNIGSLFNFSVSFNFIFTLLFFIITIVFLNISNGMENITYYLKDNIPLFFVNILPLFLLFFLLFVIPLYVICNISTITFTINQSYQQNKIKTIDILKVSLKKVGELLNIKFLISSIFMFLLVFLICNFSFILTFCPAINVLLKSNMPFSNFFLPICILIFVLTFSYLKLRYFPSYMLLEKCNFNESFKKSFSLNRGALLKELIGFLMFQFFQLILVSTIIFLGASFISLIGNLSGLTYSNIDLLNKIVNLFIIFSLFFFSFFSISINFIYTSVSFYFQKIKVNERIKPFKFKPNKRYKGNKKKIRKISFAVILFSLFSSFLFTQLFLIKPNAEVKNINKRLELTAHRGASAFYPENTMSAFIGAKKLDADWIELDVQQTSDGKVVVMHDSNFIRIAGIDKNLWETSYDEIKNLDVGSFYDKKFKGERIQLLEDVIKFAKETDIKLNIELKPTGHEKDLEKMVVDMVNKFDFQDKCIIASQNYKSLEIVKKYDNSMTTLYVIGRLHGDILSYVYADHYSLEASNIDSSLVDKVHKADKKIFAWTLNNEDVISRMIELNVDNIITDNITLAKEIYQKKEFTNRYNLALTKVFKFEA